MRGLIHDLLRTAIGFLLELLGHFLEIGHALRLLRFDRNQKELRARYQVRPETEILEYGPKLSGSIQRYVAGQRKPVELALTSGSTAEPKRLAYPASRLFAVKWAFIDAFSRAYVHIPVKRRSLYVFSSLAKDDSLTGMMLKERGLPPYLSCLQAPYRVQQHPATNVLVERYGSAAVRLFVLTLANPGVLYATNPSTISQFLSELSDANTRALICDFVQKPNQFDEKVRTIARRLESRGSRARLASIARADRALTLFDCAPAVEAYICWTGGYVAPFLARIEAQLPPQRVRRIPMYSMSTETIETVPHYRGTEVTFLPLAKGVLYEFLEEGAPDDPAALLGPKDLTPGKVYGLVVSDPYGLVRYQTRDLFRVESLVEGLPNLCFVRRRGLGYSFTGEKLTGEQVAVALDQLRREHGSRLADWFLSLVPVSPTEGAPHYRLLAVGPRPLAKSTLNLDLPWRLDQLLCAANREYADKRQSGRLGEVDLGRMELSEFAQKVASSQPRSDWESQLKFLPIYPRLFSE